MFGSLVKVSKNVQDAGSHIDVQFKERISMAVRANPGKRIDWGTVIFRFDDEWDKKTYGTEEEEEEAHRAPAFPYCICPQHQDDFWVFVSKGAKSLM